MTTVWREANLGTNAAGLSAASVYFRVFPTSGSATAWSNVGVVAVQNQEGNPTGRFRVPFSIDPTLGYAFDWDGNNGQFGSSDYTDPTKVTTATVAVYRGVDFGGTASGLSASSVKYQLRAPSNLVLVAWTSAGVVPALNMAGNPTGRFRVLAIIDPSVSYATEWDGNAGQYSTGEVNDSLTAGAVLFAVGASGVPTVKTNTERVVDCLELLLKNIKSSNGFYTDGITVDRSSDPRKLNQDKQSQYRANLTLVSIKIGNAKHDPKKSIGATIRTHQKIELICQQEVSQSQDNDPSRLYMDRLAARLRWDIKWILDWDHDLARASVVLNQQDPAFRSPSCIALRVTDEVSGPRIFPRIFQKLILEYQYLETRGGVPNSNYPTLSPTLVV